MRAGPGEVAFHRNGNLGTGTGLRIVLVNESGIFIDQLSASRIQLLDIKLGVLGDLTQFLSRGVIGKDIHGMVAVGKKIDGFTNPDRILVIAAVPGEFGD